MDVQPRTARARTGHRGRTRSGPARTDGNPRTAAQSMRTDRRPLMEGRKPTDGNPLNADEGSLKEGPTRTGGKPPNSCAEHASRATPGRHEAMETPKDSGGERASRRRRLEGPGTSRWTPPDGAGRGRTDGRRRRTRRGPARADGRRRRTGRGAVEPTEDGLRIVWVAVAGGERSRGTRPERTGEEPTGERLTCSDLWNRPSARGLPRSGSPPHDTRSRTTADGGTGWSRGASDGTEIEEP